jgi:hypothetical protein
MLRATTLVLLALPASAALGEGRAVGLKVGALGLGAEYTHELTERIAVRGGFYGSQLGFDAEEGGLDYEVDVVWDSLSVGVDFHPLKTALRLSVGLLKNDNALELVSRPSGNVTVGDTTYTPAQVGTLTGSLQFDGTATFAGLGWDWSRDASLFGMSLDIGVVDQGDPVATLRGSGTLLGNPSFEQDIRAEEIELAGEASDFDLVPFLSVGFQFRF